MSKNENQDIEREQQEIISFLRTTSGYITMPEILEACKGFDDSAELARILNKMLTAGLVNRRMGDKIGKNNRNLYEYVLTDSANLENKSVQDILSDAASKKGDTSGLKVFDAAIASLSKKLEPVRIKDYDNKIKLLAKLSHMLDDPIAGLLKDIGKDLEVIHKVHG